MFNKPDDETTEQTTERLKEQAHMYLDEFPDEKLIENMTIKIDSPKMYSEDKITGHLKEEVQELRKSGLELKCQALQDKNDLLMDAIQQLLNADGFWSTGVLREEYEKKLWKHLIDSAGLVKFECGGGNFIWVTKVQYIAYKPEPVNISGEPGELFIKEYTTPIPEMTMEIKENIPTTQEYRKSEDIMEGKIVEPIPELKHVPKELISPYGYCPKCHGRGVIRERRMDGNDKCSNGHEYPSKDAMYCCSAKSNKE